MRSWTRLRGVTPSETTAVLAIAACGACAAALLGCGGGGSAETGQANPARPSLSAATCRRLQPLARSEIGASGLASGPIRTAASGTVRLSKCTFSGRGARASITLDTASDSHQRFANRVVEEVQFSGGDPARLPRQVKGVGDPGSENGGAVWTSASAQLLAIRGNRLLIVDFYVPGAPDRRLREAAAALARRAYALTG